MFAGLPPTYLLLSKISNTKVSDNYGIQFTLPNSKDISLYYANMPMQYAAISKGCKMIFFYEIVLIFSIVLLKTSIVGTH